VIFERSALRTVSIGATRTNSFVPNSAGVGGGSTSLQAAKRSRSSVKPRRKLTLQNAAIGTTVVGVLADSTKMADLNLRANRRWLVNPLIGEATCRR
jgi:hypothetical protein